MPERNAGGWTRKWIPVLCALLLALLGAVLPFAVSVIQDANAENLRESRELNTVQLTLLRDGGIRETLQLVAEGEQATLPWNGETRMTEEEARGAAQKMMNLMSEEGMIPTAPPYSEEYVERRVIVSWDIVRPPVIVWLYVCEDIYTETLIYIDDGTGQMVRMNVETEAPPEAYVSLAESWRVFLSEYYGFELLLGDEESAEGSYRRSFPLLLDMGDRQEPCRLNLSFYGNKSLTASFNSFDS